MYVIESADESIAIGCNNKASSDATRNFTLCAAGLLPTCQTNFRDAIIYALLDTRLAHNTNCTWIYVIIRSARIHE